VKYEESIANVNVPGKQSVVLRLHPLVQRFLEMLQNDDLFYDTIEDRSHQKVSDALLIIDGQCCEGDYMVTSDEDEDHDYEAFAQCIRYHDEANDWSEDDLKSVWAKVKPFVQKERITWG